MDNIGTQHSRMGRLWGPRTGLMGNSEHPYIGAGCGQDIVRIDVTIKKPAFNETITAMSHYNYHYHYHNAEFPFRVTFPSQHMTNVLAEWPSRENVKQVHVAGGSSFLPVFRVHIARPNTLTCFLSDLRYCLHPTPQYLYFPLIFLTHIPLPYLHISFHPSVLLTLIARPPLAPVPPYAALTYSRYLATSKSVHVTLFLNSTGVSRSSSRAGKDSVSKGSSSPSLVLFPSLVVTQPEISVQGAAEKLASIVESGEYDSVMYTFAPPDMEHAAGYVFLITAGHGSVKQMRDPETGEDEEKKVIGGGDGGEEDGAL
ncbi:hypothetical protein B0H19DRAFT_1250858 [Mycena capillaripes]|nr:hypothetical protein B0H19DRAFT_1250858 [Mycena capillaripes]